MVRLRRSSVGSRTGYTRQRVGKGFSYRPVGGGPPVADPELRKRFEALAIPPAWTQVWICPYNNGHIQATGVDTAGRKQYLYHPGWREMKDRVKYDRAMKLADALPDARHQVDEHLQQEGPTRERALAAAFRMLDKGSLRVGSERYATENGSHGLSTLLCAHAVVKGDTVSLNFPAKSGQEWESVIEDPELARVVRALKRRGPNARLLAYKIGRRWHPVSAAEINEYVREQTGGAFTAKDFRTLHGTAEAAKKLAELGPEQSPTKRKKAVVEAVRAASEVLGNTPSIARASYVDPRVIDLYNTGETVDPEHVDSAPAVESELRALLYE